MLHVTTHVDGDKDPDLLSEKGGGGFPFLVFLDAEGRVAAQHKGPRTAEAFLGTMETATAFGELRKKAEGGDAAAQTEVFEKDLGMGNISSKDGRAAVEKMKDLSEEKKADYDGKLIGIEVKETVSEVSKKTKGLTPDDKPAIKKIQAESGRKFIEMKKAGRIPTGDQEMQPFWIFIMEAAEEAKDAALYEEALAPLKEKFGQSPQAKKFFAERDETLAKLKALKKE
ncbi:MAG: hypothetical protein FD180_2430 [Planctomycetota bacterium]|nr:MAG: hypothetical protein FD180_2430 [Planctomycetota bacterium]